MKKNKTICGFEIKKRKIGDIIIIDMIKWIGLELKMYSVFIYTDGNTSGYINTDTPIKGDHMHFHETMSNRMIDKVISLVVK